MYCPQEVHFRPRDTYRQKMRRIKNIFHANINKKRGGIPIVISGKKKKDFKLTTVTRDKEGHYIMITRSTQEEDITPVTIYAPNIGAP